MNFSNKTPGEPFTVLETLTSSTKARLTLQPIMNHLSMRLSTLYHNVKGAIMTTINGKLVDLNFLSSDNLPDNFKTIYQPEGEDSQDNEIKFLQVSVNALDYRFNELENNTLRKLQQKIESIEKQTSKQILAITVVGTIGFTSLGLWIGLSNNSSVAARNTFNYPELKEVYKH